MSLSGRASRWVHPAICIPCPCKLQVAGGRQHMADIIQQIHYTLWLTLVAAIHVVRAAQRVDGFPHNHGGQQLGHGARLGALRHLGGVGSAQRDPSLTALHLQKAEGGINVRGAARWMLSRQPWPFKLQDSVQRCCSRRRFGRGSLRPPHNAQLLGKLCRIICTSS